MKPTIDVMLDVETLGIADDAQVIQISAGAFHLDEVVRELGDFKSTFNFVLDLSTLGDKLSMELGTLQFWTSDSDNARVLHKLISEESGISEEILVRKLHTWFTDLLKDYSEIKLWGNGIIFDNVKIEALFKKYGLKSPIMFYNHRDVRTILELGADKLGEDINSFRNDYADGIEKHNAIHDVLYQTRYVTGAYSVLTNPEYYLEVPMN